jgi:hypothetical protein
MNTVLHTNLESQRIPCQTVFTLDLSSPLGEVDRASAPPRISTEGSPSNSDPSVIRQDRADATSPTFGRGGLKATLKLESRAR